LNARRGHGGSQAAAAPAPAPAGDGGPPRRRPRRPRPPASRWATTPLLLVQGLGFAKISRFRVSSSDAVARRKTSPSILVKLGDSVADQRCRLCFPQTTATHKNHVLWCCCIRTLTIGLSCVGPTWCRLLKFCSLVHQEQEWARVALDLVVHTR
jgi:hypothetical protein